MFFLGVKSKTDIREIHLKERVTVSTLGILFGDKKRVWSLKYLI